MMAALQIDFMASRDDANNGIGEAFS